MGYDSNLSWTIHAKQTGRIKFLALGGLMANANRTELLRFMNIREHIDRVFCASEYYRSRCCEEAPELGDLYTTWSCGIDTQYWQPSSKSIHDRIRVVVYQKNAPDDVFRSVLSVLERLRIDIRILMYGTYGPAEFRAALQSADCAVFLSRWESQGIALGEAWACDVPTFVWISDRDFSRPFSAPLLSEATGKFFCDEGDLTGLIESLYNRNLFSPRDWVQDNLTVELQATKLLAFCGLDA